MRKYFFLLLCAMTGFAGSFAMPHVPQNSVKEKAAKSYVYVCESPTAYAYHRDRDCRGLQRCTHQIKKETEKEATEGGRTPCKICTR